MTHRQYTVCNLPCFRISILKKHAVNCSIIYNVKEMSNVINSDSPQNDFLLYPESSTWREICSTRCTLQSMIFNYLWIVGVFFRSCEEFMGCIVNSKDAPDSTSNQRWQCEAFFFRWHSSCCFWPACPSCIDEGSRHHSEMICVSAVREAAPGDIDLPVQRSDTKPKEPCHKVKATVYIHSLSGIQQSLFNSVPLDLILY